ncbi:MAG TPA: TlyA family RNA methyltransferase [Thermodesulfovibrionales bacterium]|nr:TlyA family RNA methyltransferase [Thermodesulfovibrionales bacterium]
MKERLDLLLVEKGIASSRERAKALIMGGSVLVNGVPEIKAGTMVDAGAAIEMRGHEIPYVSRGGLKLEAALTYFNINPGGMIAMDVGSSTGGFTDCLLQKGATKVYCIDVGYGQMAWSIRNDPRVVLLERTNIRHLERERVGDTVDIATIDVSFISLKNVLPVVMGFIRGGGAILALVKPQFEVGKGEVGKGGIVRDEHKRTNAVNSVKEFAEEAGLKTLGIFLSPVPGQKGNREYFLYLKKQ